jgi:hypothetical protein
MRILSHLEQNTPKFAGKFGLSESQVQWSGTQKSGVFGSGQKARDDQRAFCQTDDKARSSTLLERTPDNRSGIKSIVYTLHGVHYLCPISPGRCEV